MACIRKKTGRRSPSRSRGVQRAMRLFQILFQLGQFIAQPLGNLVAELAVELVDALGLFLPQRLINAQQALQRLPAARRQPRQRPAS